MLLHPFINKTKLIENVCVCCVALLLFSASSRAALSSPKGRDLVEKSIEAGERNEEQLHSYVSRTRSDSKQLAADGSVKSEETKTFDDITVDGFHIRSLVAKDDKPLAGSDREKEESRVAKLVAQRKHETPQEAEKRRNDAKEKRDKDHRFSHELLDAFDYNVAGQETINGRKAWIVDATPHPGYEPKELKARMFPHLRGRLWIDAEDLLWVKAEADGIDQFSIGFSVIAKLNPGAHLSLEQMREPDGTWVVRRMGIKASGRLALVKRFSIESVTMSDNFRKVPAAQRIGDGKEDF